MGIKTITVTLAAILLAALAILGALSFLIMPMLISISNQARLVNWFEVVKVVILITSIVGFISVAAVTLANHCKRLLHASRE